jgi:translation initiation factor 1
MIFEMGAKLDGDSFDTKKEDKKKKSSNKIEPKKLTSASIYL